MYIPTGYKNRNFYTKNRHSGKQNMLHPCGELPRKSPIRITYSMYDRANTIISHDN